MLQDIPTMTRDEIYRARYEIAGVITQSRGLMLHLACEADTRAQSFQLRREIEAAELALLRVTRPANA